MPKRKVWKIFKLIWFSIVIVFLVWNWTTFQSRNLPANTFTSSDKIEVIETADKYTFKAKQSKHELEVIFFQGGLTDPKAYAPLCRRIAENGYTCHLIRMSLRLPQRDYKKIATMFDLQNGQFIIGGHSQGAKMAAQFVYENPETMKGLFLMGTSHPKDIDLSNRNTPTLKLYASNDGLASVGEVLENKARLPVGANLVLIEGGNHSQFGYLGTLFMDNSASITLEQQQLITLEHIVHFLNEVRDSQ